MNPAMGSPNLATLSWVWALGLCAGMVFLLELGWHLGKRRIAKDAEGARAGMSAVEGAVFALLGLLIAFTFSGAAARFDQRRALIIQEANSVGTAWLRLDLLPAAAQPPLRALYRQYVDSRLATYGKLPDFDAAKAELGRSLQLQSEIWKQAAAASQTPEGQRSAVLVLPALNQMFDIVTDRTTALQTHPPTIIFALLAGLALAGALFAGFGMSGAKRRSWIHILGFSVIMAISVYVILDLEFPRAGLIRVDAVDQLLVNVRSTMN